MQAVANGIHGMVVCIIQLVLLYKRMLQVCRRSAWVPAGSFWMCISHRTLQAPPYVHTRQCLVQVHWREAVVKDEIRATKHRIQRQSYMSALDRTHKPECNRTACAKPPKRMRPQLSASPDAIKACDVKSFSVRHAWLNLPARNQRCHLSDRKRITCSRVQVRPPSGQCILPHHVPKSSLPVLRVHFCNIWRLFAKSGEKSEISNLLFRSPRYTTLSDNFVFLHQIP